MRLTNRQRISLVKCYYQNRCNPSDAFKAYRRVSHKKQDACRVDTLESLVRKFEETGSVLEASRSRSSKELDERVAAIREQVEDVGRIGVPGECSIRGVARKTNIPTPTVQRIMRMQLGLYPYKISSLHELIPADYDLRMDFASYCIEKMEFDACWLGNILFSDEAHFFLHGKVNSRNGRIWATENPHAAVEHSLHEMKVTVWCGFTSRFIIGPYFFDRQVEGELRTQTVSGTNYNELLVNYLAPRLNELGIKNHITFQQDGAPVHISKLCKETLNYHFGERIISRGFPVAWPPRSPDFTPADYWLWGFLKDKVYRCRPSNLYELRNSIEREVRLISEEQLKSAIGNFPLRMSAAIEMHGRHVI